MLQASMGWQLITAGTSAKCQANSKTSADYITASSTTASLCQSAGETGSSGKLQAEPEDGSDACMYISGSHNTSNTTATTGVIKMATNDDNNAG